MQTLTSFGRQKHHHNPGKYRHALTIRAENLTASNSDHQPNWEGGTGYQVRGCWRQLTQRESVIEGSNFSSASGVWEIPWIPNVTTKYRVEFGTRFYRIIGISNLDERNRELHLYCIEDEGGRGVDD